MFILFFALGQAEPIDREAVLHRDHTGELLAVLGQSVQWTPAWAGDGTWMTSDEWYVDRVLPREQWVSFGVDPAMTLWVLPVDGSPAVQAGVRSVRIESPGECGGYLGLAVDFDGPDAWAAIVGDPPASWHQAVEAPSFEAAARMDRVLNERAQPQEGPHYRYLSWAIAGDEAVVRVLDLDTREEVVPDDAFGYRHEVVDLRITESVDEVHRETFFSYGDPLKLAALRDVDGDGVLDRIEDGCSRNIVSGATGEVLAASAMSYCCGC